MTDWNQDMMNMGPHPEDQEGYDRWLGERDRKMWCQFCGEVEVDKAKDSAPCPKCGRPMPAENQCRNLAAEEGGGDV